MQFLGHIWLALADNDEKGAVIEIDPETKTVISTIGKLTRSFLCDFLTKPCLPDVEDKDLVDLKFGGSELDFLYVLSEKHLYKVSGITCSADN